MATTSKWLPYQTSITAVASATMNALANAAYAYGAEYDNSTNLYLYADMEIILSGAVTTVAPASIAVFIIPATTTSNYDTSSGNPGAGYFRGTMQYPGGSQTIFHVTDLLLRPGKQKFIIQNNLGVAFPSTSTSTCLVFPYSEQSV